MIARIVLQDWQCFSGEHVVELHPGVTVVVGPNGSGKTALVEAVAWCLFGADAVRDGKREDDLPHDGARGCSVRVELEGGAYVERTRRRRGQRTLEVHDGEQRVDDRDGAAAVEQLLGVGRDGFLGAVYVPQRRVGALASATPSARREILLGQLDDGTWDALVEEAARRSVEVVSRLAGLRRTLDEVEALVGDARAPADIERDLAECDEADRLLDEMDEAVTARDEVLAALARRRTLGEAIARLREEITEPDMPIAPLPDVEPVRRASYEASAEHDSVQALARSGFDGSCPVLRDECPVASRVSERVVVAGELLERTRRRREEAAAQLRAAETAARARAREAEDARTRRAVLARRWSDLLAEYRDLELPGELPPPIDSVEYERLLTVSDRRDGLQADLAAARAATRAAARLDALRADVAATELEARAAALLERGARAVPGPVAAARDAVEAVANDLLAHAGVGLRLEWTSSSRSGAGRCPCGYRYSGARRTCPECGKARPAGRRDRVQVWVRGQGGREEPVEACGGIGDLACLALVLAASSVGGRVSVDWRVLDEPDVHAKGERLAQLGRMLSSLGGIGVRQVILTTNRERVSDSLGRVLEVVPGAGGSRIVER